MTGFARISRAIRLDLLFGRFARHAVQFQDKKLALTHVADLAKSQRRKGMLNRLPLRIEDRAFRHYPYVCFHARHYSKPSAATPE